jgi:hypothetical protein
MNIKETFSLKQLGIIIVCIFISILLFFAILRWQSSWAEELFFKATKAKLEQAIKDKEAINDNLNGEITSLNFQLNKLEDKLSKNKKALNEVSKEKVKVKEDVKNLSSKDVAKKLTEWGY